jgi:plastocyanin
LRLAARWLPIFNGYDQLRAGGVDLPDTNGPIPDNVTMADVLDAITRSRPSTLRTQFLDAYDRLSRTEKFVPKRADAAKVKLKTFVDDVNNSVVPKVFNDIPFAIGNNPGDVAQNLAEPCFRRSGGPPKKADTPCPAAQRRQIAFDGRASVYNSGLIPYDGPNGNTYEIPISPNAKPGTYYFYCAVHGPGQSTVVTIKPKGSAIQPQSTLNRAALEQVNTLAAPLAKDLRQARTGHVNIAGLDLNGPFAGIGDPAVEGSVNEFVPKTITTKVNQPVTWTILGTSHSISFDVPKYFPIMTFAKNGRVTINPKIYQPARSPKIPDTGDGQITRVDGGTYNGIGFFSSSVFGSDPYATYTLRVSKPGTYRYACLIHPAMVGTLVVQP